MMITAIHLLEAQPEALPGTFVTRLCGRASCREGVRSEGGGGRGDKGGGGRGIRAEGMNGDAGG